MYIKKKENKNKNDLILPKSDIAKMRKLYLLSLLDVLFNRQSEYLWKQTVFLINLFLYSYEVDFIHGILKKNEKKPARSFIFMFHYIDNGISLNNSKFRYVLYIDPHIESEGRLRKTLYDKKDDFNFHIVNIPFICSNMIASLAYGVYICQLIRYSIANT